MDHPEKSSPPAPVMVDTNEGSSAQAPVKEEANKTVSKRKLSSNAIKKRKAAARKKKLAEVNQLEEVDLKKLRNRIKKRRRVRDLEQMVFYNINNIQVPVFTEEFLEQNKIQDSELRQLRKLNNDFEENNSLLLKHLENLNLAIHQLQNESDRLVEFNRSAKLLVD